MIEYDNKSNPKPKPKSWSEFAYGELFCPVAATDDIYVRLSDGAINVFDGRVLDTPVVWTIEELDEDYPECIPASGKVTLTFGE